MYNLAFGQKSNINIAALAGIKQINGNLSILHNIGTVLF